jgi:hypothetical protein
MPKKVPALRNNTGAENAAMRRQNGSERMKTSLFPFIFWLLPHLLGFVPIPEHGGPKRGKFYHG